MTPIKQFIIQKGEVTGVRFLFAEDCRILRDFLSVELPDTLIRGQFDKVLNGERDWDVYAGMNYTVEINKDRSIITDQSMDIGTTYELDTVELKKLIDDWYAAFEEYQTIPHPKIVPTDVLNCEVKQQIIHGKVPCRLSFPVLRLDDGEWTVAYFGCFVTADSYVTGKIMRPAIWATADLKTGRVKNSYDCRDKDFSTAPFDVPVDLSMMGKESARRFVVDLPKLVSYFDSLRFELLATGTLNQPLYERYLDLLLQPVPEDGKRFFLELAERYRK